MFYGIVLFNSCKSNVAGSIVFSLFVGSISSIVLLLFAPGVAGRAMIPFYFLLFAPIIYSFSKVSSIKTRWILSAVVCIVSLMAIKNTYKIYKGYEHNYEVNVINHYKLSSFSYDIKNGVSTSQDIILYKLPLPAFAETMPYQRPLIEKWMKKYYELPQEVRFIWRDLHI